MTETKRTFGQFLTQCRVQKGLTQKQLGDMLYVGESAISKWEKDKRRPDLDLVSSLAEILGVTETELIRASVDKTRLKDRKQARRYRIIANTYYLSNFIIICAAFLICLIVNLVVSHTLDWFLIIIMALLCYGCVAFVPVIIKKYNLPSWIKKHNLFISLGIDLVALIILLIVIDLYGLTQGSSFGWSITVALPIVVFWSLFVLGTISLIKYIKIHGYIKTAIIIFALLTMINIFILLLNLFGIEDQGTIWNANLSKWQTDTEIASNMMLFVHAVAIMAITVFMILGFINTRKHKANSV